LFLFLTLSINAIGFFILRGLNISPESGGYGWFRQLKLFDGIYFLYLMGVAVFAFGRLLGSQICVIHPSFIFDWLVTFSNKQ